jgi:hypothetical protein
MREAIASFEALPLAGATLLEPQAGLLPSTPGATGERERGRSLLAQHFAKHLDVQPWPRSPGGAFLFGSLSAPRAGVARRDPGLDVGADLFGDVRGCAAGVRQDWGHWPRPQGIERGISQPPVFGRPRDAGDFARAGA